MKNNTKKILTFVLCASLSSFSSLALGASNYSYTPNNPTPKINTATNVTTLQGSVIYTPTGLTTKAVTTQEISSETLSQGSSVAVTLTNNLVYGSKVIAPEGSTIFGTAVTVTKAGRANHNGSLYIRFNSIVTPQGYKIPVSAIIKTSDNTGVLQGGTKKDAAKDYVINTGVGAGTGALAGTVLGAVSGGSVGLGAAYGTAIGGGLGLVKGLVDKGNPVEIPANSTIELYFDQPITISAPNGYNY